MAAAANIADADALLIDSDYVPTPTATISRQPTEHGHGSIRAAEWKWQKITGIGNDVAIDDRAKQADGGMEAASYDGIHRYTRKIRDRRQHLLTSAFSTSASTLSRKVAATWNLSLHLPHFHNLPLQPPDR